MTQNTNFGFMTTNLAAAIGVKQAIQTVNTATKTLDQQCALQENMAQEMGGIGQDAGHGLIETQFNYQMSSAQSSYNAIEDEANGTLASAIVGTLGTVGSGCALGKDWKDKDLEKSLDEAKAFKLKLADFPKTTTPGVAQIQAKGYEQDLTAQADRWKGATKEADFSSLDKNTNLDEDALRHINSQPTATADFKTINHNIEKHINDLNLKIGSERISKQNSWVNAIGQATNAGSSFANYGGMTDKAGQNQLAQEQTATANIVQNAEQTVDAQAKTASQSSSTYQSEIASILQGIAFPA